MAGSGVATEKLGVNGLRLRVPCAAEDLSIVQVSFSRKATAIILSSLFPTYEDTYDLDFHLIRSFRSPSVEVSLSHVLP